MKFICKLCNKISLENNFIIPYIISGVNELAQNFADLHKNIAHCLSKNCKNIDLQNEINFTISKIAYKNNDFINEDFNKIDFQELEKFMQNNKENIINTGENVHFSLDLSKFIINSKENQEKSQIMLPENKLQKIEAQYGKILNSTNFINFSSSSTDFEIEGNISLCENSIVILQYEIKNLANDLYFQNSSIQLNPLKEFSNNYFIIVQEIKSERIIYYKKSDFCYIILKYDSSKYQLAKFETVFSVKITEIDPVSRLEKGTYNEDFSLKNTEIYPNLYLTGISLNLIEFKYFIFDYKIIGNYTIIYHML